MDLVGHYLDLRSITVALLVCVAGGAIVLPAGAEVWPDELVDSANHTAVADTACSNEAHLEPLALTRIGGPVVLDGMSNEPAWDAVPMLPLSMYAPVYCGKMTERTEIRVAYDDTYLYVAGRLYDSRPDGIRANSLYRDRYSSDDTFAIILDTFNDNENALWFFTTPNGVRFDMAVEGDAEGGVNSDWNSYWDAEARVTPEGWFAEIRIPLSSLGFQVRGDVVTMGMSAYRFLSRKNERYLFPPIPPNWSLGWAKPSQLQKVQLRGVTAHNPLYITPYGLAGGERFARLNDDETGFETLDDQQVKIGGDLKYSVTSNLTLDLTVNTDFAQVEADDQQVNLTRFSLFFPEKRQFFQERAATLEFSTGGNDRLFHSRQIGLYRGEPVPIYGGARLVGRVGSWDFGMLNMQTAPHDPLPSENFGVYRARKQVLNANSYTGGMLTTRLGTDGNYNVAFGLDGLIRVGKQDYIETFVAQTVDKTIIDTSGFDPIKATVGRLWYQRRGQEGLSWIAAITYRGEEHNPGVGFIQRTGVTQPFGQVAYGFFPGADSRIRLIRPELGVSVFLANDDGLRESASVEGVVNIEMKSGDEYEFELEWEEELFSETLRLPDGAVVPPGRYGFWQVDGRYQTREGRLFRFEVGATVGGLYDGTGYNIGFEPVWNVSRNVELSLSYEVTSVDFPGRDGFDLHIGRLRTQIGFNRKASVNAFVQFNNADDQVGANIRFRYHFRENNDLWIVYNEGLNVNRDNFMPVPPRTGFRTVAVKYTYTIGL